MQNANIKYKIRLEGTDKEAEITMELSDFEKDLSIKDMLYALGYSFTSGWDANSYTVLERNIELFNED